MIAGLWVAASLAAADPPVPSAPCQTSAPAGSSVSGVTVTAQPDVTQTSIDRRTYAVSKNLAAQTGSVADLLRDIPDVQVDAQGNPSLQGGGNVTILIDGRPSPQFSGQTVGQALQSLSASQVDRVEVMTNPPAQYRSAGGGGIINLITKRPKGSGWTGSARLTAETLGRGPARPSVTTPQRSA
jgi:outer membrane receptor for ferrienterochelin and colicin